MTDGLSDEQRSAIFAGANQGAALSGPRRRGWRRPPKAVLWVIVIFLVLGVGGQIAGQFFGATVASPTHATHPATRVGTSQRSASGSPQSLTAFIGYRPIGAATAPRLSLTNQFGQRWTLSAHQRDIVVLAFFDASCRDICRVVGAEILQAHRLLGANASHVIFAVVNTEPRDTRVSANPPALVDPHLVGHTWVTFLTGTLHQLIGVWAAYGVTVKVGARVNQTSHNNIMYFIGPHASLGGIAQPFANESRTGIYSLGHADITRYAKGIAFAADSLIG